MSYTCWWSVAVVIHHYDVNKSLVIQSTQTLHKLYIHFCNFCCMFPWYILIFMFLLFFFIFPLLGIISNVFSADWLWRGGLVIAICGQYVWQTHVIENKKWTYRFYVLCWCGLYYYWLTNSTGCCCPDKQTDNLVTSEKWRQDQGKC